MKPFRLPPQAAFALATTLSVSTIARAQDPTNPPAPATPVAVSAPSVSAETDGKIVAEIAAHGETMTNLTYLSDEIGGRLTGSPALQRAIDWGKARMTAYGLSHVHGEPYTIPIGWDRGVGVTARVVSPDDHANLTFAAIAWTAGTKGTVRGPVIKWNPRSAAEVESYRGKLKNAILLTRPAGETMSLTTKTPDETSVDAVFNDNPRPRQTPPKPGTTPPPRLSPAERAVIAQKSQELFKSEKIAAIVSPSPRPLDLLLMYGGWPESGSESNVPAFCALQASNETYILLLRLAEAAQSPDAQSAQGATPPVEIEFNNPAHFVKGPITVENVVGDLPGSEKPDEMVVLGGHLDSWDLAQGTTDNGTGACTTLEVARALVKSGVKPKRTIRFILFTGEEEGDIGSGQYVKAHAADMPKVSMCMVDDAGTGRTIGVHTQAWSKIGAIFTSESAPTLAGLGFTRIVPGSPIPGGGGGSDHDEFEGAGVPGFILDQLDDNYHLVFHSQTDTLDKADPEALTQTAQVMAILGLHVADLPTLLPREKAKE